MKIVILGASGGIGRELVGQALAAGHEVTAIVRAESRLDERQGLRIVRGDVGDTDTLASAFAGSEVVLSALGLKVSGLSPFARAEDRTILDRTSVAIVAAMKTAGVKRVLFVSSSGIGDSAVLLPGFFKVFIAVSSMRFVFPALQRMEDVFFASGLQACAVRPTGLTDGPLTGKVVVPTKLVGQAQIPRKDVAAWMLAAASKPALRQSAVLTVTGAG